MIIIVRQGAEPSQIRDLIESVHAQGLKTSVVTGTEKTIIGVIGDTRRLDEDRLLCTPIVEVVKHVSEPFKRANRQFHPDDTVVEAGGVKIGGGHFAMIAGPCSVESREQIIEVARAVRDAGATMLRGGAFKPRTSPYDFQGLKADGLELLLEAKRETGLPIVTEIMNISHLPLFEHVDVIQVGARSMQNFELLKELGRTGKPVLLKRGLANTIKELLMAAEYVMAGGNDEIVLCERGIRTFETATRNTIDLTVIPVLKRLSHLPVIIDPSHSTGSAKLVEPLAMGATAMGADGLIIEVHNNPPCALCDGAQSQTPEMFADTMRKIAAIRPYAWQRV